MSYGSMSSPDDKLDYTMEVLRSRDYGLAWDSIFFINCNSVFMRELVSTVIWSNYSFMSDSLPHLKLLVELYLSTDENIVNAFQPYYSHAEFCDMVIDYLRFNIGEIIPFARAAIALYKGSLGGTCRAFNADEFYNNFEDLYAIGVSI